MFSQFLNSAFGEQSRTDMIGNKYLQLLKRYYINRMSFAGNLGYLRRSVAVLMSFQFFFFLTAVIILKLGTLFLLFVLLSLQFMRDPERAAIRPCLSGISVKVQDSRIALLV